MIKIAGNIVDSKTLLNMYPSMRIEAFMINILYSSSKTYEYESLDHFKFELTLRKNIVKASYDLAKSKFAFKVFSKAYCNPQYWKLSSGGGFVLRSDVKSSDAIRDIYINSAQYGTECATAIIIVYYKALVDILPEKLFLDLFPNIYLYSWLHLDPDLGLYESQNPTVYLPGDCRYFINPDHDPSKPEWQGENVIDLGKGMYYGHGIGVKTDREIIYALNTVRKPDATDSAYLMTAAKRINSHSLAEKYLAYGTGG